MMSKSYVKRTEKRPHPSSNDSSFVKNVTTRVSGLLPATITKWFSSPSSSNANGATPTAEVTDSSTEDESSETPVIIQPSAKRMRFTKFNHTDTNYNTSDIMEIPVNHYSGTQFSASPTNLTILPVQSQNEIYPNESIKDKNENDTSRFKSSKHTVASIGHSVAAKRKSIFDRTSNEDAIQQNSKLSSSDLKSPYFKPTLLGSPFYPGRTMYGRAVSPYVNQPNIQEHTVALVNETESNENSTMSTSARRIMDMLESYSSPLMEARRIPRYTKPKNESSYMSPNQSSSHEKKIFSYKTQELHVPSIASILHMKQRSRLMDTTKAARQLIASQSSSSSDPYPTTTANVSKGQSRPETMDKQSWRSKIKPRLTRTDRGNHDELDMPTPMKLPSATLQIDQDELPRFSFDQTPSVTKLSATSTPKVVFPISKPMDTTSAILLASKSKPETESSSDMFVFSPPIKVSCDTPEPRKTPPKFNFDSPERQFDSKSGVSYVVDKVKENDNKPKDWQCPDCWVSNKSEVLKCVCCGSSQPKTLKVAKCSVCKLADSQTQKDKCANCEKMPNPQMAISGNLAKWKCDGCWIMNEGSVDKCPCCGGSKPNEAIKTVKEGASAESVALAKNKTQSDGSAAGFKITQGIKSLPNAFFGSDSKGDSTFISLAKTQKSEKWECASCLVMNESQKSTCICCGAEKEPKSKLPESKFNFGLNTNTSFKFGIDPKIQEATLAQKPEVLLTPVSKLKEPSETNNNVLAETPTFTFTLPIKNTETKIDSSIEKSTQPGKFSFGIPKGVSINKLETSNYVDEKTESLQEVPQINFTPALQDNENISVSASNSLTVPEALKGERTVPSTAGTTNVEINQQQNKVASSTFLFGTNPIINISSSNSLSVPTGETLKDDRRPPVSITAQSTLSSAEKNQQANTLASSTYLFGTNPTIKISSSNLLTVPSSDPLKDERIPSDLKTIQPSVTSVEESQPLNTLASTMPTINITSANMLAVPAGEALKDDKRLTAPITLQSALSSVEKNQPQNNLTSSSYLFGANPAIKITSPNLLSVPTGEALKDDKKPSVPTTLHPVVTSIEENQPKNTFTLGSSMKSGSNLFGTTPDINSSTNLFTLPGQNSSANTSTQSTAAVTSGAPVFNFGSNGVNNITAMPSVAAAVNAEKPKLQFTFGNNSCTKTDSTPSLLAASSNTQPVFKSLFAPVSEENTKNTNTFSIPSGNALVPNNTLTSSTLSGSNGISATNPLASNSLSGNTLAGISLLGNNSLSSNTFAANNLTSGNGVASPSTLVGTNGLPGNNGIQASNTLTNNSLTSNPSNIFANVIQKENLYISQNPSSNGSSTSLFVSNSATNNQQKPSTFTFGSSTQFNTASSAPAFGNNAQSTQNIFGMGTQNNNDQPSLFSNLVQNQTPAPMFGSPQPNNNAVPRIGMFGTSNFGATNASISSFEAPSMTAAPNPAFTFGTQAPSPLFGFGQQQPQQQDQTGGVYSFGGAQPVQFNMGTTSNVSSRRIRKAARRTPR